MKKITIFGSTGSIGNNALSVISMYPEKFSIYGLTANYNINSLIKQCLKFLPKIVVVNNNIIALDLKKKLRGKFCKTEVLFGKKALIYLASILEYNTIIAAISGSAGLGSIIAGIKSKKQILLANKESLVMAGEVIMNLAHNNNVEILPIDSEHSAIFQCLQRGSKCNNEISKITLTSSGGPFLRRKLDSLYNITPEEACSHPKWIMGKKISIDSATMMNKGFEIIEAFWLFNIPSKQIDVIIHPQSIIHSLVSYIDGSVLAQLSIPDMKIPILYALSFPNRLKLELLEFNLSKISLLSFEEPDYNKFICLTLARQALLSGGTASTILNAANEVAVHAFLSCQISFLDIPKIIENVLNALPYQSILSLDDIFNADKLATKIAKSFIKKLI